MENCGNLPSEVRATKRSRFCLVLATCVAGAITLNGCAVSKGPANPTSGDPAATALVDAFETRGGFNQLDRFATVVLGDGTRCAFRSFGPLKAPAEKALDS